MTLIKKIEQIKLKSEQADSQLLSSTKSSVSKQELSKLAVEHPHKVTDMMFRYLDKDQNGLLTQRDIQNTYSIQTDDKNKQLMIDKIVNHPNIITPLQISQIEQILTTTSEGQSEAFAQPLKNASMLSKLNKLLSM